jgi:DNA replication and repair protein RecF
MHLNYLELTNFKSHRESKFHFSEGLNYFVGGNGQGKTTILEAIYLLCTTKTLGLANEEESITFQENYFNIRGNIKELTENQIFINFNTEENKKKVNLDGKLVHRASEFVGKFPVVLLSLSDHEITLGGPGERRKFVDSIISQSNSAYLKLLLEYNKILKQRTSLLLALKEAKREEFFLQLQVWNESLLKIGSQLIIHRFEFIREFIPYVQKAFSFVMEEKEIPTITYETILPNIDENEVNLVFEKELANNELAEIARTKNLVGPHRDEFHFFLNGKLLKKYGSQGQHKTFQIALRFAEFYYIMERTGKTPIFLMDDIFGELDSSRSGKIKNFLGQIGQAFITMTDFTKYEQLHTNKKDSLFMVEQGKVQIA